MTTTPTLDWLAHQRDQRREAGLRRRLKPRSLAGQRPLDLASNDYLGLAQDRRVIEAAVVAAESWGAGSTGSRLVTGSTQLHQQLEQDLADHVGTPAALVFSSGYLANLGAITALADRDTLIVSDSGNHASLIDAIRLSGAAVTITSHLDPGEVEAALRSRTQARALVVTDAVFSVDGDLAPLAILHRIAREHGAVLVVDEAHSLGVVGDGGVGACADAGISGEPDVVQTLTLSKSLGSQGGAVAASTIVVEHLINSARAFIFDTGLAPACVGAARESLSILREHPGLSAQVRNRALDLMRAATLAGWQSTSPAGAVVSVLVGDPSVAVAAAAACDASGVAVGCFRPPSVPDGVSRLRLTARANLSDSDLDRAAQALSQARSVADGRSAEPQRGARQ